VTGNTATEGGGVYADGAARIDRSTIQGNTATKKGGGVFNAGSLTLVNATVDGNVASAAVASPAAAPRLSWPQPSQITRRTTRTVAASTGRRHVWHLFVDPGGQQRPRQFARLLRHAGVYRVQPGGEPAGLQPQRRCHHRRRSAVGRAPGQRRPTSTRLPQTGARRSTCTASQCVVTTDQRNVPRPSGGSCDLGAVEVAPLSLALTLTADPVEIGVGVGSVPFRTSRERALASAPDEPAPRCFEVRSDQFAPSSLARSTSKRASSARLRSPTSSSAPSSSGRSISPPRSSAHPAVRHRARCRWWLGDAAPGHDVRGSAASDHHLRGRRRSATGAGSDARADWP